MAHPSGSFDVENLLVSDGEARRLQAVPMTSLGWREREDLQRWICAHPEVIESNLLLISEEFADWEAGGEPVRDRLDLLFLDGAGRPLVVELKRGLAPDRTESQALVYAAACDQLTTDDLVQLHARKYELSYEESRARITAHAPVLADDQPGRVRVRLVAEDFSPSVTSTVLFLRDIGAGGPETAQLDVGCIKLTAYALPHGAHVLTAQPLIPVPETEAYQVRRRKRQASDDSSREARTRVANAIPTLQRAEALPPDTELSLKLEWFGERDRKAFQQLLSEEPAWGRVVWTGEKNSQRAVIACWSEEPVSLDAHHQKMRERAGLGVQGGATSRWVGTDKDTSLRDLADALVSKTS